MLNFNEKHFRYLEFKIGVTNKNRIKDLIHTYYDENVLKVVH